METQWTVIFQVYRQKGQNPPHYDEFKLDVSPDEYVLDGVERIWAFHDRSLILAMPAIILLAGLAGCA